MLCSGIVVVKTPTRRKKEFSPKAAKQKWDHLEKMVSDKANTDVICNVPDEQINSANDFKLSVAAKSPF